MSEIKRINTKYSRVKPATKSDPNSNQLKRKAFLDALLDEAIEEPYTYSSFEEAIADLSGKFKLSLDEIKYLKQSSKDKKIKFVEEFRKKH